MQYRCGYVALIGAPNAGKSTIMNALLGDKIAIVTPKPQTTRDNIRGILTLTTAQIIFTDTPGLHIAGKKFNQLMVDRAVKALQEADMAYFIVDALKSISPSWKPFFQEVLGSVKSPVFLLLNKSDLSSPEDLKKLEKEYEKWGSFAFIDQVSAFYPQSLHKTLKMTLQYLPESPPLYPQDQVSDTTERFFVREVIREKLFENLHDELPYSCAVDIEEFKERDDGKDYIYAVIYVENQSQKKIVVGKNGEKLKMIGSRARKDVEQYLEKEVFLQLWVKVKKNWTKNPRILKELGYWDK